jgi:hypothetical protein
MQKQKDEKKSARKDRRKFVDDLGTKAQQAAEIKNISKVYNIIEKLIGNATNKCKQCSNQEQRWLNPDNSNPDR